MDNTFHENTEEMQNIFSDQALISFTISIPSKVSVEIYDLSGNQCALIPAKDFNAGEQQIRIHRASLGIQAGKYVYYLQIVNETGTSRECRTMYIN